VAELSSGKGPACSAGLGPGDRGPQGRHNASKTAPQMRVGFLDSIVLIRLDTA